MAYAVKIGSSCEGKHCIRHFARTKARKCSTTVRNNLREHNNRFLSSIGTGKVSEKRATENELGKLMPEKNGDRDHVWRHAMYTGRPKKNSINAIPQFGHRRKMDHM